MVPLGVCPAGIPGQVIPLQDSELLVGPSARKLPRFCSLVAPRARFPEGCKNSLGCPVGSPERFVERFAAGPAVGELLCDVDGPPRFVIRQAVPDAPAAGHVEEPQLAAARLAPQGV